jgi:hypothetical protein
MYLKKLSSSFAHTTSLFFLSIFFYFPSPNFFCLISNTSTRSLFDLSSTNGSFVDGEQLTALHSFRISDGSVLSFGGSTRTYTLKWHEGLKHSNILSSERHPQNRPSSPFSTFKSTSNNNSNKRRRGEDDHTNSNNNNSSSSRPSTADSSINTPRGDMSRPSTAGSSNSFMSGGGGGGAFHSLEGQSPRVSSRLSSPSPSPRDMGMEKGTSRSGRK